MKADVQYNDFIGTSAADISDHTDLTKFITSRGVDSERYKPIGASFYAGYSHFWRASILCVDNEQSTEENKYIVKIGFEAEFDKEEFFNLFKRFNVLITNEHPDYQEKEIDEELIIDDRGIE